MGAFQGQTPKRHRLWSNDFKLLEKVAEIGGSMSRADMAKLPGNDNPLVEKYLDKSGKKRHVGIAHRLKESQFLVCK